MAMSREMKAAAGVGVVGALALGAAQLLGPTPCPSDAACLTCTAPTENTDGSALRTPMAYRFWRWQGTDAELLGQASTCEWTATSQPLGEQCYTATALDAAGYESEHSAQACKTIRAPGPTDGAFEGPTDGAIEQ